MFRTGAHTGSLAAELIKQAEQWLLILLAYIQIWHSFTSIKRCAPGLTRRQPRHVAWVPGAKVLISISLLFCLSDCLFLPRISRVLLGGAAQIFFEPVPPRVRNSVGGSKAFRARIPHLLFGFWTISWDWKFTQLRGGLYTPSSSERDLPQCSLGRAYVPPPPLPQHHRHCDHKTQKFMKLLWSKEGATVQFSTTYCEMDSAVGATSCRSQEPLFYSPCAAYGFPVNPHVGPRSALHLMHSPRGRIEICTWLTI